MTTTATTALPVKAKINYIDNLRVLLTVLVIMHHTFITYGAPGGWYFTDKSTNTGALVFMTLFVATNQAFFMGFFFFISALFTESSYRKKGTAKFITDRLKRLGIPLLFYSFIFSPFLNYLVYTFGKGHNISVAQYLRGYDDWIDFGVLWFVAALLVFTLVYTAIQKITTGKAHRKISLPGNGAILVFALVLGIVSYAVRIVFPVGWVLHPVGFQLGHFSQYIALFSLGIVASRNNWLNKIDYGRGRFWLVRALLLILVMFPSLYGIKEATNSSLDAFQGNGSWQSLLSAVWEQVTGIAIIMALLGIAKAKWNGSTPLLKKMARASFATYIIHPLFVISCGLILQHWNIEPAIKLLVALPFAVTSSFIAGALIVKLPGVKNIV
ncbi:MAG TPA: acyltransferase [Chitinophagaceae bacterium]|nr:acyltransferase [Chitinophagaceae bacterium]